MDLLQEAGYRYVMDWTMDDQPIWIRTRKGRILTVPYPIEVNDTRGIIWYHYTSEEFADMIVDQFDEMLAQSARQPLVCPISLHPFVFGRPYRIRRLRKALQHILQHRTACGSHARARSAPTSSRFRQGRFPAAAEPAEVAQASYSWLTSMTTSPSSSSVSVMRLGRPVQSS